MTYKEKLTNLLKTIPSVKEDLEELKFWCKIKMEEDWEIWYWRFVNTEFVWKEWDNYFVNQTNDDWSLFDGIEWSDYTIIWNPLDYHHLMQYCWDRNIIRDIIITKQYTTIYTKDKKYIDLDNTKSFEQQTEEVYEKIVNFLTENSL